MEDTKKPTYWDFNGAFNDKLEAITKVRELKKAVETLEITLMFSNDFTNIDTEIKEIEKQVSFLKDDDFYALCNGFTWGCLSFKSEYENIKPEEIQELNEELIEDIKDWIEEDRILELEEYLTLGRSILSPFKNEILYLYHKGATQVSIIQFLKDNDISCTQANLSRWLKRQTAKTPFEIEIKDEG